MAIIYNKEMSDLISSFLIVVIDKAGIIGYHLL